MWPYPKVIAHRGGGKLAPENTVAALRCGWRHGFRAVEFDVMLTRDGIPVLMHDAEFGRTVAGVGKVAETKAEVLLSMDAGAWFGAQFVGEPVPDFERVVQFCRAHGIWMNVEIKPAPGFDVETGRVVAQAARRLFADVVDAQAGMAALPLLSSFSLAALHAARAAAPDMPRALLVEAMPPDWLRTLQELDAVALHINHRHLSAGLAREIKANGYGLFCYTVNEVARAREILSWGVDAFCTDRIDLIGPGFA